MQEVYLSRLPTATYNTQQGDTQSWSKQAGNVPCVWYADKDCHGLGDVSRIRYIPKTLAMTVVTSKLAASTPIMTPPGSPKAKNLVMTLGETPCRTAAMAEAYVTSDLGSFFCSSPTTTSQRH